jgi:hypothetical protein
MITNIDENLGRLRDKLEQLGISENTILIFMTDNGTAAGVQLDGEGYPVEGYNAGMRGKKGSEYDGGHRVPCFMHWTQGNLIGGKDVVEIASYTDILPTLIDLCQLEHPLIRFDGQSLRPLLYDQADKWESRTIITDTQRKEVCEKWRKSAVMTDRWRLIRGEELYDMTIDAGQKQNIAHQYPDVVARLRSAYDTWWASISSEFDDYGEIIIDPDKENPACLFSHDWHSESTPPWNQYQIRAGKVDNGFWVIDVAEKGSYRFGLRRWPIESGLALGSRAPVGDQIQGGRAYGAGKAISFKIARIRIDSETYEQQLRGDETEVPFTFDLEPGEMRLQTWLIDDTGTERGAYYVYVTKL